MQKFIRVLEIVGIFIAVIGGFGGFWAAYTSHSIFMFKQPFTKREGIVESYTNSISLAEKSNNKELAKKLRKECIEYEEDFRKKIKITAIVKPIEDLEPIRLKPEEKEQLKALVRTVENSPSHKLPNKTMGAAYLAIEEYGNAAVQFDVTSKGWKEPETMVLKAAAYSGLAEQTDNLIDKNKYESIVLDSIKEAYFASSNKEKLTSFIKSDVNLYKIVEKEKIKPTIP